MISLKKQNSAILFLIAFMATLEIGNTFRIARAVKMIEEFEPVIIQQVEPTVEETVPAPTEETTEPTVETVPEPTESPMKIDCALDEETQNMIYEKCVEYGVDFPLVMAVIFKESSFRPDVVSSDGGDYGLMQINRINHGWLSKELGITDFLDPEQNVTAGIYMLHQLFDKYDDPAKVLMAYNMGEGGAGKLWKQGIYSSSYAEGVLQLADKYKNEIQERMGKNNEM